jgi:predicted pyridoxine 5'-phosphate oxidase superfamily flavin-nucleotide-binding protein
MSTLAGAREGPYHAGEIEVQRRAGVREEAERVGRIVSPTLTAAAARMMAVQRLAVAASLDETSRVWASLLTGPAGFLRPVDERLMLIESHPRPTDPLARNLEARSELGLLSIDLATRRRLRFNGRAFHDRERGIFLAVEQVYGNCQKYIQSRRLELESGVLDAGPPERSSELNERQRAFVAAADTLFIASHHPDGGPDASHRGGAPGFVRPIDGRTVAFGDYPGNNMYNTLGNLAAQPRAGLLLNDFDTGATLQLTGRARLEWDPGIVASFRGAQGVVVVFEIDEILESRGAGVRGRLVEYSPVNP